MYSRCSSQLHGVESSQTHIRVISDYKLVRIKDILGIYGLFNVFLAAKTTTCVGKISTFNSAIKQWLPSCKPSLFYRIAKQNKVFRTHK